MVFRRQRDLDAVRAHYEERNETGSSYNYLFQVDNVLGVMSPDIAPEATELYRAALASAR